MTPARVSRGRGGQCSRAAVACSLVVLFARSTRAEAGNPPALSRSLELGAEFGYAFALGSLEKDSDVTDVVRGIVPFGIEAGYRLTPRVIVLLNAEYAIGVPKLCATASDCTASLGHDLALAVGSRFVLPRLGPVEPQVRATFGYEWFRSELSDKGVTSARVYSGPMLTSVQAFGNFGSDGRNLGPFITASAGIFSHRALETPAFASGSNVDRASLHVWLCFGLRGSLAF